MAKKSTSYVCSACGAESAKWLGKCPSCDAWNTMAERTEAVVTSNNRFSGIAPTQAVTALADIQDVSVTRTPSGIEELDRVLGGGFVEGAVTLIGGEPGFGKSTLLIQAAEALSQTMSVLYVSGEESGGQVAMRARRLGLSGTNVRFMGEICLERVLNVIEAEKPAFVVIDSVSTLYSDQLTSAPGSVAQVRECATVLTRLAKSTGTSIACVAHITKQGEIAGPQALAHIVDTVLMGEGDTGTPYRLLRSIKNRFGPLDLGVFAMTPQGMKPVSNPSAIFMAQHASPPAGSVIAMALEGTRPMLVELQALVSSGGPSPRRLCVGLDRDRLSMLLAVLTRHCMLSLSDQDVFVNAVGGLDLQEPATDLALVLAIYSSFADRPLPSGFCAMGEIGLTGEVRPSPRGQDRLREAQRLGMTTCIVPTANAPKKPIQGLNIIAVDRVDQALQAIKDL